MTKTNNNTNNNDDDNINNVVDQTRFKAKTIVWDYPMLLYGGTMQFETSYGGVSQIETHTFRSAFKEALSHDKLEGAKNACGYIPLTKALLRSNCLRHEVVEGEETKDTKTLLVEEYEQMNAGAIKFLTDLEMENLHKFRCKHKKITKVQQQARTDITKPHTFDRRQK